MPLSLPASVPDSLTGSPIYACVLSAMVKAIAKQAEAERDRRAKVIHADAEFQAAQTLTNAATILASVPAAMQLRYLQTLTEVGGENNSTIIFPMPIDIVKPFLDLMNKNATVASANGLKVPDTSRLGVATAKGTRTATRSAPSAAVNRAVHRDTNGVR